MSKKQTPFNNALLFRILAIVFGAISIAMGREAISQGYFWNSGYNARIGTETTGTTLSWVMIGDVGCIDFRSNSPLAVHVGTTFYFNPRQNW